MRALSVRQPFAELILRGVKTVEYRSRPTRIVGERFYIYAAGRKWDGAGRARAWSRDLALPGRGQPGGPPWMAEAANALRLFPHELPTGVIVGTAVIEKVTRQGSGIGGQGLGDGFYEWHLIDV